MQLIRPRGPLFDSFSPEKRVNRKLRRVGTVKTANKNTSAVNYQKSNKPIKEDKFDYL